MLWVKRIATGLWRLGICAVAIGAGLVIGGGWVPQKKLEPDRASVPAVPVADPSAVITAAAQPEPPEEPSAAEPGGPSSPPASEAENKPSTPSSALVSAVRVERWQLADDSEQPVGPSPQSGFAAGQPLYLSMILDGTQAAIDVMRADRPLTIQVRWIREAETGSGGAPSLVTDLTIGRPGLTDALEQQVRRQGFFQWHSWARKDTVSPGVWTVEITDREGKPLHCGQDGQPCQFSIRVG